MSWDPTLAIIVTVICISWVARTYIIYGSYKRKDKDGNTN